MKAQTTNANQLLEGLREMANMLDQQVEEQEVAVGHEHLTITRSKEKKLILPEDVPTEVIIKTLRQMEREQSQYVAVMHRIKGFPLDGAVAFDKALRTMFGWVGQKPTPGFFGNQPPKTISVKTGPGIKDVTQVPWGRVSFAMLEDGYLELQSGPIGDDGVPSFLITGEVMKKHEPLITKIAEATEALVRTESIYAGQAVRLNLEWMRRRQKFHPQTNVPQYMNLTGRRDLIFPEHVQAALNATLYERITDREKNDLLGIDERTGVLLVGDYGTGKTEVTMDLAQVAVESNWTFFVVSDVLDLPNAVQLAALYATEGTGAIVFAEDVDQANTGTTRNAIQYALDGAQSKEVNRNIITVLTTNHVEDIDPALLRPGRMDNVIHLEPADAESAERFIRRFVRDANGNSLVPENEDITEAGEAMAGYTPAFLQEIIRDAKAMTQRGPDGNYTVTCQDLVNAANAKRKQWELLERNKNKAVEPTIDALLREYLDQLPEDVHDELHDHLDDIHESTYRGR